MKSLDELEQHLNNNYQDWEERKRKAPASRFNEGRVVDQVLWNEMSSLDMELFCWEIDGTNEEWQRSILMQQRLDLVYAGLDAVDVDNSEYPL